MSLKREKSSPFHTQVRYLIWVFSMGFACILLRIWYLSIIQYEHHYAIAQKPQRRVVIERVERGRIEDRFHIPLATNQIQYNVAVCYADIRQIPRVIWEQDPKGKSKKVLARRRYIGELATFLGEQLDMPVRDVEDTIHGLASLFPHTPFVLKEDISEQLYYELKMGERKWLGIQVQRGSKRIYPKGRLACDVLGYMGGISPIEYLQIGRELSMLKEYLSAREEGKLPILPRGFSSPVEVEERVKQIKAMAYTIHDQVGKSGIEAAYDEQLRGVNGRGVYEVDLKGNTGGKLPGGETPIPGQSIVLSLSCQLQFEAEKLLAENERLQDERDSRSNKKRRHPWQRGGAIVAIDPKTGEVLALASYPRFDPGELTPAQSLMKRKEQQGQIAKWLESESYIGQIWDGKRPMERERFVRGAFYDEALYLDWDTYLDMVVAKESILYEKLRAIETIGQAVLAQEGEILETDDKDHHLFIDIIRLAADREFFPPRLLHHVANQSLAELRLLSQWNSSFSDKIRQVLYANFCRIDFLEWRGKHFDRFLAEKRKEEKRKKIAPLPYVHYLESQREELFLQFWNAHRLTCLHSLVMEEAGCPHFSSLQDLINSKDPSRERLQAILAEMGKEEQFAYLRALRTFDELNRPLIRKYPHLRQSNKGQLQKHLAAAFYPYGGFGYGRSHAFRHASPMGSIFKLIPAYAALCQQDEMGVTKLNPLTLTDDLQWTPRPGSFDQVMGYFQNGLPIKRFYKKGLLPRGYPHMGEMGLIGAIERSSNLYFSILAGDYLDSPKRLLDAASLFGVGSVTGIDLPGEYRGHLPTDVMQNKTGLYSLAIGQHALVATPLQAAMMLSAIGNGGKLLKPQILKSPIPQVRRNIPLSKRVRSHLIEGMKRVVSGEKGSARLELTDWKLQPEGAAAAYLEFHPCMIGKTGTAEILYKQTLDGKTPARLEKHTWFGTIGFTDETLEEADIVIVTYFRFGSAGRQGAPIAAALLKKWREIVEESEFNLKK